MENITLKITDYAMYDEEEREQQLEIVDGDFAEGEYVTVKICGKMFTRKVRYSRNKWADLYIVVNGNEFTYSEFYDHESFKDIDYSRYVN